MALLVFTQGYYCTVRLSVVANHNRLESYDPLGVSALGFAFGVLPIHNFFMLFRITPPGFLSGNAEECVCMSDFRKAEGLASWKTP